MIRWALIFMTIAGPLTAQTLIATRTIPARSLITAQDLALLPQNTPGALTDPAMAIGMESMQALYPNRPITAGDIGPPALVDRNQIIPLRFQIDGLSIATEGRALDRGAVGDLVRVMNLASRQIVTARVTSDAIAEVSQ